MSETFELLTDDLFGLPVSIRSGSIEISYSQSYRTVDNLNRVIPALTGPERVG